MSKTGLDLAHGGTKVVLQHWSILYSGYLFVENLSEPIGLQSRPSNIIPCVGLFLRRREQSNLRKPELAQARCWGAIRAEYSM